MKKIGFAIAAAAMAIALTPPAAASAAGNSAPNHATPMIQNVDQPRPMSSPPGPCAIWE